MKKIVINTCYGGFGLSDEAILRIRAAKEATGEAIWVNERAIRSDPVVIKVVEDMGTSADGYSAELKVIEIPDDVEWEIEDYDGIEWISEQHRRWC